MQLFVNNPLKANSIPAAEEEAGAKDDGKLKYGIQGNAANESIWNLADDGKLESLEASQVRVQIKVDYKKIKRSKSNLKKVGKNGDSAEEQKYQSIARSGLSAQKFLAI